MSAEGECDAGVRGREVVRVGGNRMLLAVVLVLSHDTGSEVSGRRVHLLGQREQLINELWIRLAVVVPAGCKD